MGDLVSNSSCVRSGWVQNVDYRWINWIQQDFHGQLVFDIWTYDQCWLSWSWQGLKYLILALSWYMEARLGEKSFEKYQDNW